MFSKVLNQETVHIEEIKTYENQAVNETFDFDKTSEIDETFGSQ
jgi:hypothetical protein